MRRTKLGGAVIGAVLLIAAVALPTLQAPAGAQEPQTMTVTKVVAGSTDVTTFPITVECETPRGPVATPADAFGPFDLMDGQSQVVTEVDLDVEFNDGVPCTIGEAIDGELPDDVTVIVTTTEGEVVDVEQLDPPGIGFDFQFAFDTLPGEITSYEITVVNTYPGDGTAEEFCGYIEGQVGQLEGLVDSLADVEELTPEQLMDLWEVLEGLFTGGLEVVPPEIESAWIDVTVAYIVVGDILADVGFDITMLTPSQAEEIGAIFGELEGQIEAIGTYLATNCIALVPLQPVETPTTAAQAAAAATPRYTG